MGVDELLSHNLDQERWRDELASRPVPAFEHLYERHPLSADFLVLGGRFFLMNIWVCLDPATEDAVGNLVVISAIICRHSVIADDLAFFVCCWISLFELDRNAAATEFDGVVAEFVAQAVFKGFQHLLGMLIAPVLLLGAKAEKDIDVFQRLRLYDLRSVKYFGIISYGSCGMRGQLNVLEGCCEMSLAAKLKELRIRNRMSLQDVADEVGASKSHIWDLETGRSKNPSIDLLTKLAKAFSVGVADIIGENPSGENEEPQLRAMYRELKDLTPKDREVIQQMMDHLISRDKIQ